MLVLLYRLDRRLSMARLAASLRREVTIFAARLRGSRRRRNYSRGRRYLILGGHCVRVGRMGRSINRTGRRRERVRQKLEK